MKKTWKEIVKLAIEAGFSQDEDQAGLSGNGERDRAIYVDEYPVGDKIAELLEMLGIEIVDEQPVNESGGA